MECDFVGVLLNNQEKVSVTEKKKKYYVILGNKKGGRLNRGFNHLVFKGKCSERVVVNLCLQSKIQMFPHTISRTESKIEG